MQLQIESTHLSGSLIVLSHETFRDDRGFFMEAYRADQFRDIGLPTGFVQDNHSGSVKGVLRGLHFQWDRPMGKLMRVTRGAAYLVAVDIRHRSPTLGRWVGFEVSDTSRKQIWAPAGIARGFCVLSEYAEIQYKCTEIYNTSGESGILWSDPAIGIEWPVADPILSKKDQHAQTLAEWLASPASKTFTYP